MGYLKDRVKTKRSKVMIGIIILLSLYKGVLVIAATLPLYVLWLSYGIWKKKPTNILTTIKIFIWMIWLMFSIFWCYWGALSQFAEVWQMIYGDFSFGKDASKILTSSEYSRKADFNNKYVYNEEQQIEVYRYNPMVRCPWGLAAFPVISFNFDVSLGPCDGFETPERYWRDLNTQEQLIKLFGEGCRVNSVEFEKCREERNWHKGEGSYYRYILLTDDETAEVKSAIAVKLLSYGEEVEVIEAKELSSLQWLLLNGVF